MLEHHGYEYRMRHKTVNKVELNQFLKDRASQEVVKEQEIKDCTAQKHNISPVT